MPTSLHFVTIARWYRIAIVGEVSRTRRRCSPREILREDYLVPLGLSANQLAQALNVPANRVSGIVARKRAVTADTALRARQ